MSVPAPTVPAPTKPQNATFANVRLSFAAFVRSAHGTPGTPAPVHAAGPLVFTSAPRLSDASPDLAFESPAKTAPVMSATPASAPPVASTTVFGPRVGEGTGGVEVGGGGGALKVSVTIADVPLPAVMVVSALSYPASFASMVREPGSTKISSSMGARPMVCPSICTSAPPTFTLIVRAPTWTRA
jgi:hypothetical protein